MSTKELLKKLWKDESAISGIEYGILAAIVGSILYTGAQYLMTQTNSKFQEVGNKIASAGRDG